MRSEAEMYKLYRKIYYVKEGKAAECENVVGSENEISV